MPIEAGTTIAQLDESWPLGTDPTSSGDNHLRLIKAVLKAQFPGEAGDGLAAVIDATEAEMNHLVGVTSNIQEQLDALATSRDAMFPVGHHLFTTNTNNPSTYGYPGVWVLLESDIAIQTANVGNVGTTLGDNDVEVPVPLHDHTATFSGNALAGHAHWAGNLVRNNWANTTNMPNGWRTRSNSGYSAAEHHDGVGTAEPKSSSESAGTPSGSVNVDNAGVDGVTIDVRGKRKNLLCWYRTT